MNKKRKEALVKELYEKYPYPAREVNSPQEIIYFAEWVAKIFNEKKEFWRGKKILELGCGTGELANALALSGARVTAIDFSSSAIAHAKKLSKKLGTQNHTTFIKHNILSYGGNESFDVVIALGSLHHTINARKGLTIACSHLKKEGLLVIGLYNKYSRLRHRLRRIILWLFCGANIEKRIFLGKKLFGGGDEKGRAWLADKYGQVHESYHSISEVLRWFREEQIDFVSSKPRFNQPVIDEINWLIRKREAFFVMVGKTR